MWFVSFKPSYARRVQTSLEQYNVMGDIYVFKVSAPRHTNIVVTDLTNFYFMSEHNAKRYFDLEKKSLHPIPKTLFHDRLSEKYTITL